MKKTLFAFALCVLMLGCVTTSMLKINPLTLDGQKKMTQAGLKAVASEKNVKVTIRSATDTFTLEEHPRLVVTVLGSAGAFTFSPKNIQVFVDDNPHRIFTYEELVADIKEREKVKKDKAEKVKEAAYSSGGSGGMDTTAANMEYNASLNRIEKETAAALKELKDTALQSITAKRGVEYSGHVTLDRIANPTEPHRIKVIVKANKETHEFLLEQVEVEEK